MTALRFAVSADVSFKFHAEGPEGTRITRRFETFMPGAVAHETSVRCPQHIMPT